MGAETPNQASPGAKEILLRHPLFVVALAHLAGIGLGDLLDGPVFWLCAASVATGLVALLSDRGRPWLLCLLLPLAGWTNLAARKAVLSPVDLQVLLHGETKLASLRGVLLETPTLSVYEHDGAPSWRTLARVRITAAAFPHEWAPATGSIIVKSPGILGSNYYAGRMVELTGVLRPPKGPVAEGLFDYPAYLARQGIHYELKTEGATDWQIDASEPAAPPPPWSDRFLQWARRVLARGLPGEDEALRLTWAMALGWKTALTDEVAAPFMESGTMHVFAISGLHVALIAGILVSLLRFARIPRGWCGLVVIPLIWLYTGATGWQASAIRSTIMMTVIIGGWALKRPGNLLNSLGAAAFIILLWDPQQLFQAGFILSFLVVFFMAILVPAFDRLRDRLMQTDPLLPAELVPKWRQQLDWPLRVISGSFATSLAAWLGSLPVIASYFNLFTPVSLLANLVVVPLSSLALMCNLGSLITGDWLPYFTELFNHSGWFFMAGMIALSEWFAGLPWAYWHVPAPGGLGFALYYATLALLFSGWLLRPERRPVAAGLLAVLTVIALVTWKKLHDRTQITILAAGSGDAILTDRPGSREDLLIDAGDRSLEKFVIRPYLYGRGINHLPELVLTHGDVRHVGGASDVLDAFHVNEVFTSDLSFRSPPYRELTRKLDQTPQRRRLVHRGDSIGPWQLLHPAAGDRHGQADDGAMVLAGSFDGVRVLLCSDLGRLGQRALFESGQDLRADVVVAGVPTQGEPLNDALLERIRPRAIIISCGEYPANERVASALRERLARTGVPVFYTENDGSVTLEFKPQRCELRTMNGHRLFLEVVKP